MDSDGLGGMMIPPSFFLGLIGIGTLAGDATNMFALVFFFVVVTFVVVVVATADLLAFFDGGGSGGVTSDKGVAGTTVFGTGFGFGAFAVTVVGPEVGTVAGTGTGVSMVLILFGVSRKSRRVVSWTKTKRRDRLRVEGSSLALTFDALGH